MKIYLHIVNNRPFVYAYGKDEDVETDIKDFIKQAERWSRGATFTQRPDRCEDNLDFFGSDGSLVHVITLTDDVIKRHI